jgi:hypothetical protein
MNLGLEAAEIARLDMQILVENWSGGVAVIDGELSDELTGSKRAWSQWGRAIEEALERARLAGQIAERIMGDDNGGDYRQQDAARDLVAKHHLSPRNTSITLTGAWIDDSGDGCVHSVRETLEEFGFKPTIEDAMNLDFEIDCEDDSEDEDDVTPVVSRKSSPRP